MERAASRLGYHAVQEVSIVKKSLSIIMPVHNVQSDVQREVERLLEIVADITPDFEILVVDDGSTDGTEEVVYELSCIYPQVRCRRHTPKQGKATAVDLGLAAAKGEFVMIQDMERPLSNDDITSLWAMHLDAVAAKQDRPVREVMQRTTPFVPSDPQPLGADLLDRLSHWGADVSQLRAEEVGHCDRGDLQHPHEVVQPPAPKLRMPRFLRRLQEFAAGE